MSYAPAKDFSTSHNLPQHQLKNKKELEISVRFYFTLDVVVRSLYEDGTCITHLGLVDIGATSTT